MFNIAELEGAKISYAKLHGGDAFIPGLPSLGNTLPPLGKSVQMEMTHQKEGVCIYFPKYKTHALVPWANIQIVGYAKE